ncbi:unnamed protein product [Cyprideis torosa]|uniref:Uncharacterized protein n=1 Tax=Cyprideis torosa TaxID=163714 RepID=A0A7R8WEZ7_9CRUS|nr:unnamed protein product [Cyprideis torosa]CAG0894875.1 unnamed protein product [Cyprideis torosa]
MEIDNFILLWISSMAWTYTNGICRTDLATDRTIEHNGACFFIATREETGSDKWIDAEKHCQNNLNGHIALTDYDLLVKAEPMLGRYFWVAPHVIGGGYFERRLSLDLEVQILDVLEITVEFGPYPEEVSNMEQL